LGEWWKFNTARANFAGAGTQTAALVFGGGYTPFGTTFRIEEYNGTSWTATPALNTARYGLAGAGTQTAALAFGGFIPPPSAATELWNGTSWTGQILQD
jgi:hypothetical protein